MNIKGKVRQLLEEASKRKTYGCVMLYLDVDNDVWKNITDVINKDDLYEGDSTQAGEYGVENKPHVTILFGVHADVPDFKIDELLANIKKPKVALKEVSAFLNNPDFDVLKYDISSPDLVALNKEFTDNVEYTTDHPKYHAHATIAYLKKGTAERYIKQLNQKEALDIQPDRIIYSKPDGTDKNYKLK